MDGFIPNSRNNIVCLHYMSMVVCCRRTISRHQKEQRNRRGAHSRFTGYLKEEKKLLASFNAGLNTWAKTDWSQSTK